MKKHQVMSSEVSCLGHFSHISSLDSNLDGLIRVGMNMY